MKQWMVTGTMIVAMAMLAGCPTIYQPLVGSWQSDALDETWTFQSDSNLVITTAAPDTIEDPYKIVNDSDPANVQIDLTVPTGTDDTTEVLQCLLTINGSTLTIAFGSTTVRPTDFSNADSVLTFTKQ